MSQRKAVDKIIEKLRSQLERCVPDPADRDRCEKLCRDLRIQYQATLGAWDVTLQHGKVLEHRIEELEALLGEKP